MIKLFNKDTIDSLSINENDPEANYKRYLKKLVSENPQTFITNIETDYQALTIADHLIPISVSSVKENNCHVCSPWSFYAGFSGEKAASLQNPIINHGVRPLVKGFKKLLLWGKIDKIVIVNNWLWSTNLFPDLTLKELEEVNSFLIKRFPRHAIAYRSVNEVEQPRYLNSLQEFGFHLIPSRPIYLVDTKENEHFKSRMFKSDQKILKNTDYEIIDETEIREEDLPRIIELYNMLYIKKYSELNPQWSVEFLQLLIKEKILSFRFFRKDNVIDAVLGFYIKNGIVTSPLFGYDINKQQNLGLYRMISTLLSLETRKIEAKLNMSAGAGSYKKLRRGKQAIEYNAIYSKHLTIPRQLPWVCLEKLLRNIGIPIMQKLDA